MLNGVDASQLVLSLCMAKQDFLMVPGVTCIYALYATILRASLNNDAGYADVTNNAIGPLL